MLQLASFSQPLQPVIDYHPTRSSYQKRLDVYQLREMPERVTNLLFHLYAVISMDRDVSNGVRSASSWPAQH